MNLALHRPPAGPDASRDGRIRLVTFVNGLPLGVQLVGARHRDGQLLRTARWLVAHLSSDR